jgi:hypothetical protein
MSHLGCTCGYSITDNSDKLPWKAYYLPDEDVEHALDAVMARVEEFIEVRERGQQQSYLWEEWISLAQPEHTLRDLLHHMFSHPAFTFGRKLYECENCGRLWVQAVPDSSL